MANYIRIMDSVVADVGATPKIPSINEGYLDCHRYLAEAHSDRFPEQASRSDWHVHDPKTKGSCQQSGVDGVWAAQRGARPRTGP